MSYNVDSVDCLKIDAQMFAKDIRDLITELSKTDFGIPEVCFLEELNIDGVPDTTPVKLNNLWWYGSGSGRSFENLINKVGPKIFGHVEAVFTWEGGDSFGGLIIDDGKVTKCDVKHILVPRKGA